MGLRAACPLCPPLYPSLQDSQKTVSDIDMKNIATQVTDEKRGIRGARGGTDPKFNFKQTFKYNEF